MSKPYQNDDSSYNGSQYNNDSYNNGGYNNGNGYNDNNRGPGGPGGPGGPNGPGGPGNGPGRDPKRQNIILLIVAAIFTMILVSMIMNGLGGSTKEVSYSQFIQLVEEDKVARVRCFSDRLEFSLKSEESGQEKENSETAQTHNGENPMEKQLGIFGVPTQNYMTIRVQDDQLTQRLLDHNVEFQGQTTTLFDSIISILITVVLPIGLMWVLLSYLFRKMSKGGMMGVGKSTAKVYVQKETGVTFKDVAGEDEAKESLVEVVDFLHNPGKYSQIGAKLPKGALLVGPPGTGKTLLARAVAGEAHVPFFSLAGSDFIELYVGVGASRVRDLFREAEKNAPCIVFIDEIDAIGRSRDSKYGGSEEREQTLNQLLSEMDGFDGKNGIIILAATNRPEILDKALLRPGRFDRRIIVDKPDLKGRIEILRVHAKDVLMDDSVDLREIALATSGAVGSDLANMINEAAINAVKMGRQYVSQRDLFDAVEQVLVGKEKKDRIMSKEERRIVSYHEVGHALVSALQKNSEPVQKITIVPRTMGALGYVMQTPEEEKYLNTEAELRDMLVGLVAGRAAEEIVFDTVTTGASNDIEKATGIARAMVTQYGMSKKFGLMGLETIESKYLEGRPVMNCSDTTAADVDTEVMKLMKESYKEAKRLLKENRAILDKIAEYLIEKETITGKEFMKIFRKEKGLPEPVEETKEEPKQGPAVPGNYGRPQGDGFRQGPPQGNPYQNGAPGGNMPQGNPYRNGAPGGNMPPGNSWQQTPPPNPYQNGNLQSGVNSRQAAWDAQYRQNHWSNQQNLPGQGKVPGQPNPYQQGQAAGQPNPYQQGKAPGQPNPYQQGQMTGQPNPYQQGQMPGQPNPYQQGKAPGQPNPYQQGQMPGQPNPYQQPQNAAGQENSSRQGTPAERGSFSGALKEAVERTDEQEFILYEDPRESDVPALSEQEKVSEAAVMEKPAEDTFEAENKIVIQETEITRQETEETPHPESQGSFEEADEPDKEEHLQTEPDKEENEE